jgi:hypothetical protein
MEREELFACRKYCEDAKNVEATYSADDLAQGMEELYHSQCGYCTARFMSEQDLKDIEAEKKEWEESDAADCMPEPVGLILEGMNKDMQNLR